MKERDVIRHTISGVLTPCDSRRFFPRVFAVPEGAVALDITFQWEPEVLDDKIKTRELIERKLASYARHFDALRFDEADRPEFDGERLDAIVEQVSPLRNLLNLSLYDPAGNFRGRWDRRHFGKSARVGAGAAAYGFYPGPIRAGEWTIELDAHMIVTQECAYRLDVDVEMAMGVYRQGAVDVDSESAVGADIGAAAASNALWTGTNTTPHHPNAPRASKGSWLRGELHLHTWHSDGVAPLAELIREAERARLDFIALTDHNTTSGHGEIPRGGRDESRGLIVIPGMEFTTFFGHAVALGINDYIDWRIEAPDGFDAKIGAVHERGGLFQVAHPFSMGDPLCSGCEWLYGNVDYSRVDLVEVWSGSWTGNYWPNRLAFRLWETLLNNGMRVTAVAARDVHRPEGLREPADCANTHVWALSPSVEGILEGLRAGRAYVSAGPAISFTVEKVGGGRSDGVVGCIGDTVQAAAGEVLRFDVIVSGMAEDGWGAGRIAGGRLIVNLVRNGHVVATTRAGEDGRDREHADAECAAGVDRKAGENADGESGRVEACFLVAARGTEWYRCDILADDGGEKPEKPVPRRLLAFTNPIFVKAWEPVLPD